MKDSNKKAGLSLIFAFLGITSYVASTLVISLINPTTPGFLVYFFSLFGLGGVLALVGLILGILGVCKPRLKAVAIIAIILCSIILIAVLYALIMRLFSF